MSKKFNIHDWQAKQRQQSLNESLNPEVSRALDRFIRTMADKYNYSMQDAVYAIMAALKQRNYDGLGEHHNDKDFPGKDLSAWDLLDKIKDGNEDLYNKVEDFMKSMKEMNSLGSSGAGSKFNSGNSMDVAVPNAFGDDKKKKMKAYKSIGYKKI